MTREEIKEMLPMMQAWADGKAMQFRKKGTVEWIDLYEDDLRVSPIYHYRIKPEPKYRPFKTQEECWVEMLKHQPFGWIINKVDNRRTSISMIYNFITTQSETKVITVGKAYTLKEAFNNLTFTDGTPFGIKEE